MTSFGLVKPSVASNYFGNAGSSKSGLGRTGIKTAETQPDSIFNAKNNTINQLDMTNFRQTKDPVFTAFEYIDKQPVSKLAGDFLQENILDPFMDWLAA